MNFSLDCGIGPRSDLPGHRRQESGCRTRPGSAYSGAPHCGVGTFILPSKSSQIRVGVGGWTFEPWRGDVLPRRAGAEARARICEPPPHLYRDQRHLLRHQKPESFASWREETPEDFVFSVKGPRFATNRRVLAEAGQSIERFLESGVLELKEKLGPINWQFLPTKQFDAADFEAFLELLPRGGRARAPARGRGAPCELPRARIRCAAATHRVAVVLADTGISADPRRDRAFRLCAPARRIGEDAAGYAPDGSTLGQARAGSGQRATRRTACPHRRPAKERQSPRRVHLHDQRLQAESTSRRHGADRAVGVSGAGLGIIIPYCNTISYR